ncbi:MAG: hypothetical protein ABSB39_14625 [Candidatus Sulfotelmatobacter sp.]|jgi:hypothetical protein
MIEAFSLKELAAMPVDHDPSPDEIPSIGFCGKISRDALGRVYEIREAERRRRELPAGLTALNRIHDHLVGLAQDIAVEYEEKSE